LNLKSRTEHLHEVRLHLIAITAPFTKQLSCFYFKILCNVHDQ
jgi:hypothetical protein